MSDHTDIALDYSNVISVSKILVNSILSVSLIIDEIEKHVRFMLGAILTSPSNF